MILGGRHAGYCERYASRKDALAGHVRAVEIAKSKTDIYSASHPGDVEAFRHAPDVSPEKPAGMELIAGACAEFESMSDLDIEQLVQKVVSAPATTKDA
jgi:hypothetical protein